MVNKVLDEFFSRMDNLGLALTFDDVLLMPCRSSVVPRDVNLETRITRNVPLKIPITSADMDTVTEAQMAIMLAKSGGIGFIHRNMTTEAQADEVDKVKFTLNAYIENPGCLRPDNTLGDMLSEMAGYDDRFSSFIITDDKGKLKGLVTKDQTKFYDPKQKKDIPLRDLMIKPVSVDHKVELKEAYDIMKAKRISKLIITNESGLVVGLYCWNDVKDIVENTNPTFNRDARGQLRVGASVGPLDFERAEKLLQKRVDVLLVGTAHGHSDNVGNTVRELKARFTDYTFDVLAGNVATQEGAEYLIACGADGIKVGIGPGGICTTRIIAGVGVPQVTAVYDSCQGAGEIPVCADGGVIFSGDAVKVLAVGASSIMCGGIFAATKESPGEEIIVKGKPHKVYRGMGSIEAMKEYAESQARYKQDEENPEKLVPEGIKGVVPLKGYAVDTIAMLAGGIRNGMGYVGAPTIEMLHEKAVLRRQTSAGKKESHPHDVEITSESPNYRAEDQGGD